MHFRRGKVSFRPLLALLTTLLSLALTGVAGAQATSRTFAMGLYVDLAPPGLTSVDGEILMFGEGQPQPPPPALTIMKLKSYEFAGGVIIANEGYDWSRVVAVLVDEPYLAALQEKYGVDTDQNPNPCSHDGGRMAVVTKTAQQLSAAAAAVKSVIPYARFWVNFNGPSEVSWMMDNSCPLALNQSYIDVISLDDYWKNFSPTVQSEYTWIAGHRATPYQQMALIPGTFYRSGIDAESTQAGIIPGYFNYAITTNANQGCNLPLPPRGVTGIYDGCPFWMIMGFAALSHTERNTLYVGEQDSAMIGRVWHSEVGTPIRADLASKRTRKQLATALMHQWINE